MPGGQERALRRRIRTVQSTKKITRAMELISASRIAKASRGSANRSAHLYTSSGHGLGSARGTFTFGNGCAGEAASRSVSVAQVQNARKDCRATRIVFGAQPLLVKYAASSSGVTASGSTPSALAIRAT